MTKVTKSPLATHAFNPNTLPKPLPQCDLGNNLSPSADLSGLEAMAIAREENRKRARWLIRHGGTHGDTLRTWLLGATTKLLLPLSPASSFCMRTCRRKVLGAVMAHVYGLGLCDFKVMAFTLTTADVLVNFNIATILMPTVQFSGSAPRDFR